MIQLYDIFSLEQELQRHEDKILSIGGSLSWQVFIRLPMLVSDGGINLRPRLIICGLFGKASRKSKVNCARSLCQSCVIGVSGDSLCSTSRSVGSFLSASNSYLSSRSGQIIRSLSNPFDIRLSFNAITAFSSPCVRNRARAIG